MLTALRCYKVYLAVQAHFKRDDYNAFRYRFKTNASSDALNNRRDRHFFVRLANTFTREQDLIEYLVANMVADAFYLQDMNKATYLEWQNRMTRRLYQFRLDMKALACYIPELGFDAVFINDNGQYPLMLKKYMAGEIALESVVIFNKLTGAVKTMPDFDPMIWPDLKRKIVKYAPFIPLEDRDRYMSTFLEIMNEANSQNTDDTES